MRTQVRQCLATKWWSLFFFRKISQRAAVCVVSICTCWNPSGEWSWTLLSVPSAAVVFAVHIPRTTPERVPAGRCLPGDGRGGTGVRASRPARGEHSGLNNKCQEVPLQNWRQADFHLGTQYPSYYNRLYDVTSDEGYVIDQYFMRLHLMMHGFQMAARCLQTLGPINLTSTDKWKSIMG